MIRIPTKSSPIPGYVSVAKADMRRLRKLISATEYLVEHMCGWGPVMCQLEGLRDASKLGKGK